MLSNALLDDQGAILELAAGVYSGGRFVGTYVVVSGKSALEVAGNREDVVS